MIEAGLQKNNTYSGAGDAFHKDKDLLEGRNCIRSTDAIRTNCIDEEAFEKVRQRLSLSSVNFIANHISYKGQSECSTGPLSTCPACNWNLIW